MEWLLLGLLGTLITGAAAYFFRDVGEEGNKPQNKFTKVVEDTEKEKIDKQPQPSGAKSSLDFPEVKQKISFKVDPEDLQKFKTIISKAPSPLTPQVQETDDLKKTVEEIKRDIHKKKKPLKVTYTTDEIIPRISPFSRHRRPLHNAERFVEEQKAKEALSIYERIEKRIPDEEIKQKIRTNIEDIKKWLLGLDEDEEPIEFPEIIIPLSAQTVALEQFNEGLKKISSDIAKEISKILHDGLKDIQANLNIKEAQIQSANLQSPLNIKNAQVESASIQSSDIDSKQISTDSIQVKGSKKITDKLDEMISNDIAIKPSISNVGEIENIISPTKLESDQIIKKQRSDYYTIVPTFIQKIPKTLQKQSGIKEIQYFEVLSPIGPKVPTRPEEYFKSVTSREDFQVDSKGNLITDGWTDEDFDREWEKYKHLPLIDRRSGVDRRKDHNYDPNKPDRRSGEDRRKINLFEERDKFLEKYQKHLERKKLLEEQKDSISIIPKTEQVSTTIPVIIPLSSEEEEIPDKIELPDPETEQQEEVLKTPLYTSSSSELESIQKKESFESLNIDVEPITESLDQKDDTLSKIIEQDKVEITSSEDILKNQLREDLNPLDLPEGIAEETDIISLEIPDIDAQDSNIELLEEAAEETPTSYSKVEIVEPKLEELNLPDPEEFLVTQEEDITKEEAQDSDFNTQPPSLEEEGAVESPSQPSGQESKQNFGEGVEEADIPEMPETPETKGPVQEIRGVLELKTPDEDDAPFLTLTYDFSKIPDSFQLSKNYHTLEFVYYKYKPLLIKAQEFARRKMLKNALNYYRMIKSQNIPPEFKRMINRNIQDITDYIEKFMMSRAGD